MLEKKRQAVWTFDTTTQALRAEDACKSAGLPGRLIPTPADLQAECGLAWCAETELREKTDRLFAARGVAVSFTGDYLL